MLVFLLPLCSVLWLDVLSIPGGRRLSAFGCQNGFVGLALVNQTGPGEAKQKKKKKKNVSVRFRESDLSDVIQLLYTPAPLPRLPC